MQALAGGVVHLGFFSTRVGSKGGPWRGSLSNLPYSPRPRTAIFFANTKVLLISMVKTYLAMLMDPKQRLFPQFLILSMDQISLSLFQILNMFLGHNKINLSLGTLIAFLSESFYLRFLALIPLVLYGRTHLSLLSPLRWTLFFLMNYMGISLLMLLSYHSQPICFRMFIFISCDSRSSI